MPVLFGRAFLFVFGRQIYFEVIIGAVKKDTAKIPLIVLFVTVVKEFNVFFVGCPDKEAAVINLVFRNRNAVLKMRKNGGNGF